MPIATRAFAATAADKPLVPYSFERRDPGPDDVLIEIKYCGICHSDLHMARSETGPASYPLVPGHEIAGVVKAVGSSVVRFKEGDRVGVGCMVDSCRECSSCREGLEQYCVPGFTGTYGGKDRKGGTAETITQGGYSDHITVDQHFVVTIPDSLPLDVAAPLLCAGVTTYSPLKEWKVGPGSKVAVIGLGGLGHMAVKLAAAMGAEVTVLSTSDRKKADAERQDMGVLAFLSDVISGVDTVIAGLAGDDYDEEGAAAGSNSEYEPKPAPKDDELASGILSLRFTVMCVRSLTKRTVMR